MSKAGDLLRKISGRNKPMPSPIRNTTPSPNTPIPTPQQQKQYSDYARKVISGQVKQSLPTPQEASRFKQIARGYSGGSQSITTNQKQAIEKKARDLVQSQKTAQRNKQILIQAQKLNEQEKIRQRKNLLMNRVRSGNITTPQAQNLIKNYQNELLRQRNVNLKKTFNTVYDFISGGKVTQKNITQKETELNKAVKLFNDKYSGKDLTPEQYQQAQKEKQILDIRKNQIENQKQKYEKSFKKTVIGDRFWGSHEYTLNQKEIKSQQRTLENLKKRLAKRQAKGKGTKTILRQIDSIQQALSSGKVTLAYSDVPITPVGTVGAITKATKIEFVGTQRLGQNGEIISDIAFYTKDGKKVGLVKGVTVNSNGKYITVTAGKVGKIAYKIPSGKAGIKDIRSIVGIEKSGQKLATGNIERELEILNQNKKTGKILTLEKRIKKLLQGSRGKSAIVKGNKFFSRAGKVVKGVDKSDFISIASITDKGTLSKIIGNSISSKGAKSDFIGYILKGEGAKSFSSGSSTVSKLQQEQALKKVIGAVSNALAKTNRLGKALTKSQKIVSASNILKNSFNKVTPSMLKPQSVLKQAPQIPKQILVKRKTKGITVNKQKIQLTNAKNNLSPIIKQKQNQIEKLKNKFKQNLQSETKTRIKSKINTAQKELLKLKLAQKQIQELKSKITSRSPAFSYGINSSLKIIPLIRKKKKNIPTKKQTSKMTGFFVYAKPVKGKKLVKVNKVPVTKKQALDLRNYVADNTLSRTAEIKPTKQAPKNVKYKVPVSYSEKTKNKFRNYRIVKGKKKPLPSSRVIEKRKDILDTKGEKKGLRVRRLISKLDKEKKIIQNNVKKSKSLSSNYKKYTNKARKKGLTSSQRTLLLINLEKARAAKKRKNLKKKKSSNIRRK